VRRIREWVRANRNLPGSAFIKALNRKLVGHYNYFGLRGNLNALYRFYSGAVRCAFKWLNRRGGKRSSFTWRQFDAAMKRLGVARPRITEKQREHVVFA